MVLATAAQRGRKQHTRDSISRLGIWDGVTSHKQQPGKPKAPISPKQYTGDVIRQGEGKSRRFFGGL